PTCASRSTRSSGAAASARRTRPTSRPTRFRYGGVRDGKFTSHYSRTYVEAAQRQPESEVPRVSDRQWQALDLLARLAEEQCFDMSFAPGDIQFVNNHVIYHARSAFEDDDEGHDRLLLRLWLSMPNSRPLPASHQAPR